MKVQSSRFRVSGLSDLKHNSEKAVAQKAQRRHKVLTL